MSGVDHGREPCPHRIFDDMGGAFGMGAVGGGIWYMYKGMRNSPKGARVLGGIEAIRRESPRLGGSFAVWGGLFSTFDCALVAVRKKEDPWNSILSGALTGGVLQMRHGPASSARHFMLGGMVLAMIEGMSIMLTRMIAPQPPPLDMDGQPMAPGDPMMAPQPAGQIPDEVKGESGSIWNTLFGGDEKPAEEEKPAGLSSRPQMPAELVSDDKTGFLKS